MRKIFLLSLIVVFFVFVFLFINKKDNDKIKIAIFSSISHPALDASAKGFIEGIKELYGDKVEIKNFNAQGIAQEAQIIAKNIAQDASIKAVFTIATLATQSMANQKPEIPLVFSAVTDPESLGIKDKLKTFSGVSDMVDAKKQILAIKNIKPELSKISIIFNPAEINSTIQKEEIIKACKEYNINIKEIAVNSLSDIKSAVFIGCDFAKDILIPTDNLLASGVSLLVREAASQNCSVFASDVLLKEKGAFAAFGVDYEKSGKRASQLLFDLLHQKLAPWERAEGFLR